MLIQVSNTFLYLFNKIFRKNNFCKSQVFKNVKLIIKELSYSFSGIHLISSACKSWVNFRANTKGSQKVGLNTLKQYR